MRRAAVAAGLLAALAAPPASSQPAPAAQNAGWRAAAAAALAFGDAEGKMLALRRHAITAAPTAKAAADALLDELDRLAHSAREGYLIVERYGSPCWTVAAEVRIGDVFVCQAEKILDIPMPPAAGTIPLEVLDGLVSPIREEGARHWKQAAASSAASGLWSRIARERLAGITSPDC